MPPQKNTHEYFMQEALLLAQKALDAGEIPVGAVVVDENGEIIGRGFNLVETNHSQTEHAEMIAIKQAAQYKKDWRLEKCWLYVTLEPCLMCLGAISHSRFEGVAFGARSPEFGGLKMLDPEQKSYFLKNLMLFRDLKEDECAGMLKVFFKKARGEEYCESTLSLSGKNQRKS
ncbi:nucleoside deaminase [Candidatus Dependentiae bacterium]|nr:nucleoside deaminase [Candidatus Dependentiae bacterium]